MDDKVIALVASVYAFFWVASPASAATLHLSPNGVDDTVQLQAALDSCTGAVTACRIVLGSGTFRTQLLLVENFRGRLRGQGVGNTVIQPVLGRQLKASLTPYAAPPTLASPYPALLHFTGGGDIEIADLTLDFPSQMSVSGWYGIFWNTLLAAILVDGGAQEQARLSVARIEVLARPCRKQFDLMSNVMAAVLFGGKRAWLPNPAVLTEAERLSGGSLSVTDTYVRGTGIGFAVHDASAVEVRIVDNDIQGTHKNAVSLFELAGSRVRLVGNRIAAEGTVINNYRGFRNFVDPQQALPDSRASTFTIARNVINFSAPGTAEFGPFGADPIVSVDWLGNRVQPMPDAGIDTWVIRDNDIVMEDKGRAITMIGDRGRALIAHNRIYGREGVEGIIVQSSQETRTVRNVFIDWPADTPHLMLGAFTQECSVMEPGSIVLDLGLNNRVVAAEVRTSAP
jgi:hypothetical protein